MSHPIPNRPPLKPLSRPKTLREAVELFNQHHLSRVAPKTADWYKPRLARFSEYVGESTPLEEIQSWQIEVWFSSLYESQTLHANNPLRDNAKTSYSLDTIHGHGRAIKKLFNWLRKMKILPHNPAEELELPRLNRKPKAGISHENFLKLVKFLSQPEGDLNQLRDKAIVLFLGTTGVRVEGLVGLKRADINLSERVAMVTEKGSKTRYVFFTEETAQAIRAYHAKAPRHDFVFLSDWRGEFRPISSEGVRLMVARRCRQAQLPHQRPHDFRRYFASRAVELGSDLYWLKTILGHEALTTTQIYVTYNNATLKQKYDQLF
jgi:site-specific recombinase XerD